MSHQTIFKTDPKAATIFVMKVLPADVSELWEYFADRNLLSSWWAPQPWRCEILSMNFTPGGKWHYAMAGPNGEREYAGVRYNEIRKNRTISWSDFFADENGVENVNLPLTDWLIGFTGVQQGAKLTINIHCKSPEDLQKLLDMGFEEGFKMTLDHLYKVMAVRKASAGSE